MNLELETSVLAGQKPGNLALCRTDVSASATECLGWIDIERPFEDIMKPLPMRINGSGKTVVDHTLNWRYEDGLLRSVGQDGYATDLCLGPNTTVTALDGYTLNPYELFLQDCPGVQRIKENVFDHGTTARTRSRTASSIATRTSDETTPVEDTATASPTRHMRFLIVGDGRVVSLVPVFDPKNPGKDIIAEKPFCVTIMKWGEDQHTKAYLIPCRDDNSYNEVRDKEIGRIEEQIRPQQQFFDTSARSSFESFIFNWQNECDNTVQFAYQIGHNGASSSTDNEKNYDRFDSFQIKVMSDGNPELNQDPSLMFEATVSPGYGTSQSGISSFPLSNFQVAGSMEAHLIGSARGGLEASWLASTSFEVSKISHNQFPNNWTYTIFAFWAIMVVYGIFVGLNKACCPTTKKTKRESERSASTTTTIPNGNDTNWGTTILELHRVDEYDIDPNDIETPDETERSVHTESINTESINTEDLTISTNSDIDSNEARQILIPKPTRLSIRAI